MLTLRLVRTSEPRYRWGSAPYPGAVSAAPLAVGFDLDMTLIDTRPGFMACLQALGEEEGVVFDLEAMVARLGPPLDFMLEPYVPLERIPGLIDRFRDLYPESAIGPTQAFPGAHAALEAVRSHAGRSVVITGKYAPNAQLHIDALGLDVDLVVGSVWGVGKAEVILEQGISVYVGDHVHDVEGALAAGVHSVSVVTGGCAADELWEAGTHTVLSSLEEFPDWLQDHLAARETPESRAS